MSLTVWNNQGRARSFKKAPNAIAFYRNVKASGGQAMIEHRKTGRVFGSIN